VSLSRVFAVVAVVLLTAACATTEPSDPRAPAAAVTPPPAPTPPPLPEFFESDRWIVTLARDGDTAETLAQRYLGDASKAWMIEDYAGTRSFVGGQEVVIPRRDWNPAGVTPNGYELVPILAYHNIGAESKGRMVLGVKKFSDQMRYLHAEGYRVISLRRFLDAVTERRQLPRKSVVLTFDDGYKSFQQYAAPILKELGFTATLFVYLDYVGAGRNALTWQDLKDLAADGFDVQAHSKSHADLRRAANEPEAQYVRRMQSELGQPLSRLRQQIGSAETLAYPYGYWDDHLVRQVREHGYVAAFTVRRQTNPTFVTPFHINRSQVYGEMTLEEFIRNLNVFHAEEIR
jgi:peptidoglycan/xylan/chitin deacetylase (PgdA/CDA1 family)